MSIGARTGTLPRIPLFVYPDLENPAHLNSAGWCSHFTLHGHWPCLLVLLVVVCVEIGRGAPILDLALFCRDREMPMVQATTHCRRINGFNEQERKGEMERSKEREDVSEL